MTDRTFLVVANQQREGIEGVIDTIATRLAASGVTLRMAAPDGSTATVPVADCEVVIVLGGDGTFLRAAEIAHPAGVPVLGINLGHIGFLAEAEANRLDQVLDQLVAGDYRVEDRMTLDIRVELADGSSAENWALNEVSIQNTSRRGVLEVVTEVDGRPVSAYGADGLLISTPTGSTAYAFSAGGPVMWPDLEAILIVPNNAHALFARALVTSPNAVVAVEIQAGQDAQLFCDGRRLIDVPRGGRIEVVRSANPVRWVRIDSAPFADRLVRKFHLPVTGWRGRVEPIPTQPETGEVPDA